MGKRKLADLNKAIMEEEAKSGGNSDESLLKFFGNFGADNVFDIGTNVGVEILSELGECWGREEEKERKKRECKNEIEATHFIKLIKIGERGRRYEHSINGGAVGIYKSGGG